MRISDGSSDVCSSDLTDHIVRVVQPIGRADGQVDIAVAEAGDGLRAFGHALEVPVDLDRDGRFEVGLGEQHLADPGKGPAVDPYRGRRAALQHRDALQREDRKSTRRTPVTNANLVCRLLLDKNKTKIPYITCKKKKHDSVNTCVKAPK